MTESMLAAIDLSELSNKQLAKEFRVTQKQIKSMSFDTEAQLFQKLTDIRYFTIGGCLPPLLQALTAKKKYTVEHEKLLGVFDTFVGNPAFSGSQNAGFVSQALKHTLNSAGDLNVFRVLSDMTMYREEVKIVKANKGIPIEVQSENESAYFFRYASLKILCSITLSLSSPYSIDQKLVQSFASMVTLADSICSVLENLRIRYDDQTTKDGMLREGTWALRILLFVFRGCPSTLKCLLSGKVLDALRVFAGEESLSLYCLQIFEIISNSSNEEFLIIIDEIMVTRVIDAVLIATEESTHRMDTASAASTGNSASTPGKGKSIKKEKATVSNEINTLGASKADMSDAFKQTRRQKLACIKAAADILSAICCKNGYAITDPLIDRLMIYFSRVLNDRNIWELAQSSSTEPFDVCWSDVLERCCILIGSLGLIDSTRRRAACETGALTLLLSVMQNSMAIFSCTIAPSASILQSASIDDPAASVIVKKERGLKSAQRVKIVEPPRSEICTPREQREKIRKVWSLRQVIEKSFLCLVGEIAAPEIVTDAVRTSSTSPKRWHSAALYSLDHSLFEALCSDEDDRTYQTDGSTAKLFPASALMELICCAADVDLGSRGLRLLAAVLEGTHNPVALLKTFKLDATAMGSLSNAVQARVVILLKTFDVKLKKVAVIDPNINTNFVSLDFSEVIECTEVDTMESTALISLDEYNDVPLEMSEAAVRSEKLCTLGDGEVSYLSLIVLETTVRLSATAINIFATRDRLVLLASLLDKCGPTGNGEGSFGHPAAEATMECEVHLHDPRNDGRLSVGDAMTEIVLLRPIIFDIVALIAASEESHRVLEPEAPSQPLSIGPVVYSSPCREAALSAARLCGDVTVSTLLVQGRYALQPSFKCATRITAIASDGKKLDLSVLDAALGCLLSMARSGAINLYAILESVADADSLVREEASNTRSSSMTGLREFLINLPSEGVMHTDNKANGDRIVDITADPRSSLNSKQTWTRALFFDQLFSGPTFETVPSIVLNNPPMWPYMAMCAALIGIISDIAATVQTTSLAARTIDKFCRVDNLAASAQPVVADSLATFFISMGGASALAGALCKFGTFCLGSTSAEEDVEQHGLAMDFLCYLVGRGRDREAYWQCKLPAASSTPSDSKVQRAAAAAKDLEKKSKDKNAKDQKKGKSGTRMPEDASTVEDVSWNLESDGCHPDPNRGPNREFWKSLLESRVDERHTRSLTSTLLLVSLQGGLTALVGNIIGEGAGLQMADARGVTPLMYSLFLGDEQSASDLIDAGANIDAVDDQGNPAITYACHSASFNDLERVLVGPISVDVPGEVTSLILGSPCRMLPLLLAAGVDSSACSALGNSPILSVMGLGSVSLLIGGYRITVGSRGYAGVSFFGTVLGDVQSLLCHGAEVNACNRKGVVPLHIAAARGHRELMDVLKAHRALTNVKDAGGYLPIHYVAAACPASACDIFDYLLDCSKNRPLQRLTFSNVRERDKLKGQEKDISRKMREIFDDSLGVTSIRSHRLSEQDLLQNLSDEGMNLVQLCMSARALQLEPFMNLLCGEKIERIALIKYVIAKADADLLSCVDCRGMTVMHASSLLLTGCTATRTLSAAELRSKRIKTYPSPELELLDAIRHKGGLIESNECDRTVFLHGFSSLSGSSSFSWTPLHGAIAANNPDLVTVLLNEGQYDLGRHFYVHFLANTDSDPSVCDHIIRECSSPACYGALLNDQASPHWAARPLHLAVRARNFNVVYRLLQCSKIDLNARDEESGMTAMHEACRKGDLDALRIFSTVADRLDLLTVDSEGQTCTELAICTKNIPMLELLIMMRRNDVLENVLRASDEPSILMQLELENLSLAKALGFCDPSCLSAEEYSNEELNIIYAESNAIPVVHQDAVKLSPISMAESQTTDSNCVGNDKEAFGIRSIIRGNIPTTEMLFESDQILRCLVVAARNAGIPEEFHAQSCFFEGLLYSEYAVRIH